MNYFGHAVLAHRYHPDPTFVLGAMLPDLVQLTDDPLVGIEDARLLAGIDFHHRTDALFHGSPTFVGLCHHALAAARAAGVRKGPARGMTHLVVELIIDAKLAEDPIAQAAYMQALSARPEAIRGRPRLAEGLDWLHARGPGVHNATVERLTTVLGVALRGRPRLEPLEAELEAALAAWKDLPARVAADFDRLGADLAPLLDDTDGPASSRLGGSIHELHRDRPVTSPP